MNKSEVWLSRRDRWSSLSSKSGMGRETEGEGGRRKVGVTVKNEKKSDPAGSSGPNFQRGREVESFGFVESTWHYVAPPFFFLFS